MSQSTLHARWLAPKWTRAGHAYSRPAFVQAFAIGTAAWNIPGDAQNHEQNSSQVGAAADE